MALDQETAELLLQIKADVSDLTAKMGQAEESAKGVGDGMQQSSVHATEFGSKIKKALDPMRSIDMAVGKFIKRIIGVGAIYRAMYSVVKLVTQSMKDFETYMPDDKNVQALKRYNTELLAMRVEIGSRLIPAKKAWHGLIVEIGQQLGLATGKVSEFKLAFDKLAAGGAAPKTLEQMKNELAAYNAETERLSKGTTKVVEYTRQGMTERTEVSVPGLDTQQLADRAKVEAEMQAQVAAKEREVQKVREDGNKKSVSDIKESTDAYIYFGDTAIKVSRSFYEGRQQGLAAQEARDKAYEGARLAFYDEQAQRSTDSLNEGIEMRREAQEAEAKEEEDRLREQVELRKQLIEELNEFELGADVAKWQAKDALLEQALLTEDEKRRLHAYYQSEIDRAQAQGEQDKYQAQLNSASEYVGVVGAVVGQIRDIYAAQYDYVRQQEDEKVASAVATAQAEGKSAQEVEAIRQQVAAQGNARAKAAWEKQKRADIAMAIIGAAQAIINCYKTYTPIVATIMAALVGVATGIQIAKMSSQQYPGMAAGGLVQQGTTSTADDVGARLSRGEYVSPAKSVGYYGPGVYEAMRSRSIPRAVFAGMQLPSPRGAPSLHLASGGLVTGQTDAATGGETTIVNFLDPNLMDRYLSSPRGRRSIVNVIRERSFDVNKALGG
jgi:hypothetical protein